MPRYIRIPRRRLRRGGYPAGPRRAGLNLGRGRLLIALVIAVGSLIAYYGKREYNPITDEVQHISMSVDQEIALGIQAAPEMAQQHGGLHPDAGAQALVDEVGRKLVEGTAAGDTPYQFAFHLLADPNTVNAFALPGGQVFITAALYSRLESEGQLAGVLGHEVGHVVGRHGAENLARAQLAQGLTGAAVIATYDPNNPASTQSAAVAAMIGQLVTMRYGRDAELESDKLGVRFMAKAGYDPRSMVRVMEILAEASEGARPPEFFSTHPNPENRVARIEEAVAATFPNGVPEGLKP